MLSFLWFLVLLCLAAPSDLETTEAVAAPSDLETTEVVAEPSGVVTTEVLVLPSDIDTTEVLVDKRSATDGGLTIISPGENGLFIAGQSVTIQWSVTDQTCAVCVNIIARTGQITSLSCYSPSTATSATFSLPATAPIGVYTLQLTQCGLTASVDVQLAAYSTYTVSYNSTTTSTQTAFTGYLTVTTTYPVVTTVGGVATTLQKVIVTVPQTLTTNLVETVQSVGYVAA